MGGISSNQNQHIEKELGADFPEGEVFVGFDNNSNICYANSIIQSFFQCKEFRKSILDYKKEDSAVNDFIFSYFMQDNILSISLELFSSLTKMKKKTGVTNIKKLMSYAKRKNEIFKGDLHQDCHEFFMWYINEIDDVLNFKHKKQITKNGKANGRLTASQVQSNEPRKQNWLEKIFQGSFATKTECLNCKIETEREEPFFNLSLDLEPNTSLSYCIRKISDPEEMKGADKFYCDNCRSKQDARKRILLKNLPSTLIIHFKRFKYDEKYNQMVKLGQKIPFPLDLKIKSVNLSFFLRTLQNYRSVPSENAYKYYDLSAIIIHYGQGIQFGHYIALIKIQTKWYIFDDDQIKMYPELDIYYVYGRSSGSSNTGCAYMLFYNEKQR